MSGHGARGALTFELDAAIAAGRTTGRFLAKWRAGAAAAWLDLPRVQALATGTGSDFRWAALAGPGRLSDGRAVTVFVYAEDHDLGPDRLRLRVVDAAGRDLPLPGLAPLPVLGDRDDVTVGDVRVR